LSHSYKSTYTVGSFGTNTDYYANLGAGFYSVVEEDGFRGLVKDQSMNFIPEYQYSSVSINEQINPLINVDMTWHNSLITKFEMGRSRLISLSLNGGNKVNETRNKEYTFGAGYRFKEVQISINQKPVKSDLNIRFDFTIKDNFTIIRFLELEAEREEDNRITTGGKQFRMSFTADYVFSENFNIQFYFDREVNKPFTSETFPRAETNVGFSLRLSL
jgi:cell surface protein SprA